MTEMVTGVDLVKAQIRIAAGEPLSEILRGPVAIRGHAIECRINAEHPETFAPSPGRITGLNLPGGAGIRVDTAAYQDGVIPPYYDSLVAKLIAYGADRDEAIARMNRALDMFVVEGIYTSIPLHQRILAHPDFVAGKLDTGFLARMGVRREEVTALQRQDLFDRLAFDDAPGVSVWPDSHNCRAVGIDDVAVGCQVEGEHFFRHHLGLASRPAADQFP